MTVAMATGTAFAKPSIVFVSAHPDDSEGFAATAFLLMKDYDLHVVDVTRGENGLGLTGRLDGSTERIRMDEERAACALLGATPHFLHDVNGAAQMNCTSVDALIHILTNLNPVAVFTHWPIDAHADHVQAAAVTRHALMRTTLRPEQYFFEVLPSQTHNWHPVYSVDVSATFPRKVAFLRKYACQNEGGFLVKSNERRAALRGGQRVPPVSFAETFATFSGQPIRGGVLEKLVETAIVRPGKE